MPGASGTLSVRRSTHAGICHRFDNCPGHAPRSGCAPIAARSRPRQVRARLTPSPPQSPSARRANRVEPSGCDHAVPLFVGCVDAPDLRSCCKGPRGRMRARGATARVIIPVLVHSIHPDAAPVPTRARRARSPGVLGTHPGVQHDEQADRPNSTAVDVPLPSASCTWGTYATIPSAT